MNSVSPPPPGYAIGDRGLKMLQWLPLLQATFALMIVCSYFESLKSYIALKLTITKKVANMQHTALRGHLWGATVPILIFLKRSRHADLKSFTTYHF